MNWIEEQRNVKEEEFLIMFCENEYDESFVKDIKNGPNNFTNFLKKWKINSDSETIIKEILNYKLDIDVFDNENQLISTINDKRLEIERFIKLIDCFLSNEKEIMEDSFNTKRKLINKKKELSSNYNYLIDNLSDKIEILKQTGNEIEINEWKQKLVKFDNLEKEKLCFNWDDKVCDCFREKRLLDFQRVVKSINNDSLSRKILRFKYMDLTNPTDEIIEIINNRSNQWGAVVVTETSTSFGIYRNNSKKKVVLFLIKQFGDMKKEFFKTNEYDNFSFMKKTTTFDKPTIDDKTREEMEYRELSLIFHCGENEQEEKNQFVIKYEIYAESDYDHYEKDYYVSIEGNIENAFDGKFSNDTFLMFDEKLGKKGKYREKVTNIVLFTVQ